MLRERQLISELYLREVVIYHGRYRRAASALVCYAMCKCTYV